MRRFSGQLKNVLVNFSTKEDLKMNEISIPMDRDQWRVVLDALLDKYPDCDVVDLIVETIPDMMDFYHKRGF